MTSSSTCTAPDHVLRVGRLGSPLLARLEVRDPALAAAIDEPMRSRSIAAAAPSAGCGAR